MDKTKLLASILICELAGILGSFFTTPAIPTWYRTLNKPSFNPPNWLFSPVWITLYALMGISLYLVWMRGYRENSIAINAFATQLSLNVLWSAAFFGMNSVLNGLIVVVLLWLAILATIILFKKVSRAAAYLLIPYIVWVSFALVLNFSLWVLN